MKKRSTNHPTSQPCPPDQEIPPAIPPSTPPPAAPVTAGTTLDFAYFGPEDSAKGFNGGKMVQHTMPLEGETHTFVFSLRAGPHTRRTLVELTVKALLGPCTVAVKDGETKTLEAGDPPMIIPPGSTFTLQTTAKAVLLITSLGDPGLGDPGNESER